MEVVFNIYFLLTCPGDGYAAKAAAHEMNGLSNFYACSMMSLHFPLMVVLPC